MLNNPQRCKVYYEDGKRKIVCFCGEVCNKSMLRHIRQSHPEEWKKWGLEFVTLKNQGLSSQAIIERFKTEDGKLLFTSSVVEMEILKLVEAEEAELKTLPKSQIDEWEPDPFELQRTSVWSFQKRGEWAVHQNEYRGNWPPMVPRNLILKYTEDKDIVLDPFVGGGTTLFEAWLTNRRSFGVDVSPIAIKTTEQRLLEMEQASKKSGKVNLDSKLKPILLEGDARKLKQLLSEVGVNNGSVKLSCLHPPYLNSLRYTANITEDLSTISDRVVFCDQMQDIASQIYELLADDGICAILMGDVRKNKRVVPMGFLVMERFLKEGFALKDIIIKIQHRDSSTRFWYTQRDKIDYLMAHEYLFIFSK